MLRHVLACLPVQGPSEACMEASLAFAAGYGSWLTGLVVREPAPPPYPPIVNTMEPAFPSSELLAVYEHEREAHEKRMDELQRSLWQQFAAACRKRGVSGGTLVRHGDPRDCVAGVAITADLVCVGRGKREGSPLGSTSGWMARHLARPILIAGAAQPPLRKVAVAFDGSPASARALSLAADIARHWREPLVVDVIHAKRPGAVADVLEPARHYLTLYEVDHGLHEPTGDPAAALVSTAEDLGSDLLVMGAYGHSLARELLLGSTTQQVVSHWSKPLLLWR